MSDELSIQQQKSATPYVLGGAIVGGGAAAGLGVKGPKWATAPAKYSSYDDILKESSDEFTKNMEGVEEDLKTKAEKARKAFNEAGTTYDNDLQKYINENTKTLPNDDELVKTMQEKERALNAKREELVKQEADKIRKAQPAAVAEPNKKPVLSEGAAEAAESMKKEIEVETERLETLQKELNARSKQLADDLYKATDRVVSLETANASKDEINAARAEVTKIENKLNSEIKGIVDEMGFSGKENQVKQAKVAKVKEIRAHIDTMVSQRSYDGYYTEVVQDLAKTRKEALKNLEVIKKDFSNLYATSNEQFGTQLERSLKAEQARLNKLTEFKSLYEKAVLDTGNKRMGRTSFFNSLTKEQAEDFNRLVGKNNRNVDDAIAKAIRNSRDKLEIIKTSSDQLNKVAGKIQELGGEGAYIKDGVLYNKSGKKVDLKVGLTSGELSVPKSKKLTALEKKLAQIEGGAKPAAAADNAVRLTEEQILEKAKANVTDDMVKAEKDALDAARKAVEKKTATLSPKTKEQLTKEFVEKNGTKDDVVKKAAENFKDDLKKLYEGKINNKKLAGIIAGGVVIGALAGLMLKPKNKNA